MEHRRLTEKDVAGADTYLTLAVKSALAQVLAPGCIEKTEAQPPRWRENIIGRKLVETYVLAGCYLHLVDISGLDKPEPEFDFTLYQYDELSQLEAELYRLNALELVRDYRLFLDILDREVRSQLDEKNDPLKRMGEALEIEMSPEVMTALREAAEKSAAPGGEDA